MASRGSILTVAVPKGFGLARAVCSYGYFLLAPNVWDPTKQVLHRPLRGDQDRLIPTTLSQRHPDRLQIACADRVGRSEATKLRAQVTRMLRLDEDFRLWRRLHPAARRAGFDRLFRSPSLFEDMVKTITGCNVTWPNTMRMNALLCERIGQGGFPTAQQLAQVRVDRLKQRCRVGYRAQRIVRLARDVVKGRLDLRPFEDPAASTDAVFNRFLTIYGIGAYAAGNLCQLVGRYDRLAIDTETYRHFRQVHHTPTPANPKRLHKQIEAYYAQYAPYQFLAYWFELWQAYQARFGSAQAWHADDHGPNFTANHLR